MKSIRSCEIKRPGIFLMLDFDGTLAPIVKEPSRAHLPADIKRWLAELASRKDVKVGIVTGRSLDDIRRRVGLKNLIYAANHGLEIFHNGRYLLRKGRIYKKPIHLLACKLCDSLSNISGVIVEDKGLSVAVHYRKTNARLRPFVDKIVKKLSKSYLKKYDLQLTAGKMILEIRPAKHWNKGDAVLWLWRKLAPRYMPVYIGDDITDEDAFLAIKPYGLGIRVGKKRRSHARFHINTIRDIIIK